eukprot:TRINITY_DN14292_c0_g1_i5.p1 TRINITY_DN14292_c0_g1~~TRINITY_DN14292_c0_g1_i5.p1  ORF type:complete len:434 (+),score=109.16 TRINITY_DN14292_c0_g1_i5:56-1303(+)
MAGLLPDIDTPMEDIPDTEDTKEVHEVAPSLKGNVSKCFIDCLVVIDAVHDFLDIDGKFTQVYGEEDTAEVRTCAKSLDELVARARALDVDVVMVSSHYKPKQFRTAEGVCSTPEGSRIVLPAAKGLRVIYKNGNSVVESGSKQWLLEKVCQKRIAVCGVTIPACIAASVAALQGKCAHIFVPRDAVAARVSSVKAVERTFATFEKNKAEVTVVPTWEMLLSTPAPEPELYYVNGSVPSIRVQMALHEYNISHRAHRLKVMATPKPTRSPEFLEINHRGLTPVFAEQGVNMRESLAILTYLGYTQRALIIPGGAWAPECLALAQESEKLRLNLGCLEAFYQEVPDSCVPGILREISILIKELKVWDGYCKGDAFLCGTPKMNIADCAFFPILMFCVRRGMVKLQFLYFIGKQKKK